MSEIFTLPSGEIADFSSNDGIIDAYRAIKDAEAQIKSLKNHLNIKMVELTEKQDEYELNKFFKVKKTKVVRTSYPMGILRELFDADQVALMVKPVGKTVKEMAKELDAEERKALEDSKVEDSTHYTYKVTEI